MKHPPDWIDGAVGLRHILEELSAVERSVEGGGGRAGPCVDEGPWDGPEFSVETVSDSGMHTVVDISLRDPGPRPPGWDGPSGDEVVVLRSTVRALLDLAGVCTGRAWTTVVLTGGGPRVASCRVGAGDTVFVRERVPGRD